MTVRLVVVGGDAAGMAAASEVRRRRPDIEIVALERGAWTSYSACGIPYLVGGEVGGLDELVARTPAEFAQRGIDARTGHEAVELDLDARQVHVRDVARGETYILGFDLLQLATGARPVRPPVPGVDGPNVYGVQTLSDANTLLATVTTEPPRRVCVVGSGYIGLELAEAFLRRGADVTVVERRTEVMATLDPDMGALVRQAMEGLGIHVRLREHLLAVEKDRVVTSSGDIPADLVVLGTGVEPEVSLGEGAGLAIGPSGALEVDRQQRASADGVFAAGDCCESFHLVARRPVHVPLGTHANKQGRVAGINLAGGYATFPGVVGTAVTKICHAEIGRTGLGEQEAIGAGYRVFATSTAATTSAGYLAEAEETMVKVIAERGSGRLLGTQIVGGSASAKRVDVAATAVMAGMTLEEVVHLDLGYAPPFSPVWDPFLVAVRRALGQLG